MRWVKKTGEARVRISLIRWMILGLALVGLNAFAAEPQAVMLEDMTWTEVHQAVKSGATAASFRGRSPPRSREYDRTPGAATQVRGGRFELARRDC